MIQIPHILVLSQEPLLRRRVRAVLAGDRWGRSEAAPACSFEGSGLSRR